MNDKKEKIVLDVAYQPQVRTGADTRRIMIDVIIALMPALVVAIIQFGWYPIAVCLVSMASAVFFEWAYRKLMKKTCTIGDCSAALTGLLMALTMPASSPLWLPIIGTFFAIVVVKQLYGGIGKNFLNPALAGRAFLIASYANHMTTWIVPNSLKGVVDGTTMATPMTYLYSGEAMPAYLNYKNIILGNMPGCIGEISAIALLIGAAYLLIRYFGSYPEGVSYGILIMNLCTWAIDKAFCRPQFGVTKEDLAAAKAAKKAAKEGA